MRGIYYQLSLDPSNSDTYIYIYIYNARPCIIAYALVESGVVLYTQLSKWDVLWSDYIYKPNEVPDYFTSHNWHTQGSLFYYDTRESDGITKILIKKLSENVNNYCIKTMNLMSKLIFGRIDTHNINWATFAVRHFIICQYFTERPFERSWSVNWTHFHRHVYNPFMDIFNGTHLL